MSKLLRGNFEPAREVNDTTAGKESLQERFEREALKKLGGSIAFVAKKEVMWGDEEDDVTK
jgi:hypothetical protein